MALFKLHCCSRRQVIPVRSAPVQLVVVLLALLLGSCFAESPHASHPPTAMLSPTASLASTPTPPSPSPTVPPLGAVPQNCPPGPAPQPVDPNFGSAVGAGPVWGVGMIGPHAELVWGPAEAARYYSQNVWHHKFLYVVATTIGGLVTIHGANLRDGVPLRPSADDQAPASSATTLVLDTHDPTITNRVDQWTELPGDLAIPEAGCYALEADWPGGHWRVTFAAGEVPSD